MQEGVTLVFAGGDRRMVTAARSFAAEGATVLMTGFDRYGQSAPGLQFVHQLQRAIPRADGLILPLPYTQGGGILNAPFSEKQILLEGCLMNYYAAKNK